MPVHHAQNTTMSRLKGKYTVGPQGQQDLHNRSHLRASLQNKPTIMTYIQVFFVAKLEVQNE